MSLELFFTVFGVIFVAELPDKTALAALVLATRHKAAPVFVGAGLALTAQSVIATAAGSLVAKLPTDYVHIGSGVLFIVCAIVMWVRKPDDDDEGADNPPTGFLRTVWTVFAIVFIAEFGDLTQIATADFQAQYHDWLTVGVASAAALWAVAAIAVFVGNRAGKLLDPKLTQKVAAVAFAAIGAVMIIRAVM